METILKPLYSITLSNIVPVAFPRNFYISREAAIAIARVRGCRWWLMGAFWGTLFQVVVAPVQWAMAKGHIIGKTVSYQMTAEAARLEIEDNEVQRLTIEEVDEPSAPKVQISNLDRLVNWSNEFLGRRDNDRVYPVPIIRGEQAARNSSTTVDMSMDKENNKGGQPRP